MVSSQLDNVPLRVASWWDTPPIPTTDEATEIACWYDAPTGETTTGSIEIALTGTFKDHKLGLTGGVGRDYNHAKLGVSLDPNKPYAIFGDMNQQGTLNPTTDRESEHPDEKTCWISQNARGGMFFVMSHEGMYRSLYELLRGETSPLGSTNMPTPPGG